jgi:small multidrug resistance family-3 protein
VVRLFATTRGVLLHLAMSVRSIALFVAAAVAEIGGAYMVWVGLREGRGLGAVAVGAVALALYGLIAAQQSSNEFGRVLAAYGGVFVVGSLLWGVVFDGFKPDRLDLAGAAVCLIGIGMIMCVPR